MCKKAIIIVSLVEECYEATEKKIEKEIQEDSIVPWAMKIEKVIIIER